MCSHDKQSYFSLRIQNKICNFSNYKDVSFDQRHENCSPSRSTKDQHNHLTSSAHKIMNISFFPSHWQFCKMYTLDMLVITCMPSHMTGHAPVNRFNPGYRWRTLGESVSHDRRHMCNPGVGSRTLWRPLRHTPSPQSSVPYCYEQT